MGVPATNHDSTTRSSSWTVFDRRAYDRVMRIINETVLDGRDVARLVRACARAHGLAPQALDGLTLQLRHDEKLAGLFDARVRPGSAEIVLAPPSRWVEPGVVERLAQIDEGDQVPTRVARVVKTAVEFVLRTLATRSPSPSRRDRRDPVVARAPALRYRLGTTNAVVPSCWRGRSHG